MSSPVEPKQGVVATVPDDDGLGREERIALHLALRESIEQMKAGLTTDARDTIKLLRSFR